MTAKPARRQRTPQAASISRQLLAWYDRNRRELPWRMADPDPYRIWVSEIMLQQTRVDTVLRYYDRFLDAFPDVQALAAANDDQLLLQWEGLGYYRRARNLRNGARIVAEEWLGKRNRWPQTAAEWRELPGIGAYTAAAIASICFDEPAAVVDGNVKRVLARLFGIELAIDTSAGTKTLQQRADELVPVARPGDHNQALMELGAVVCTPKSPRCGECPISAECVALRDGRVTVLPVKTPKKAIPHHHIAAAVIRNADGAILIQRRPDDGMLGGLWELPSVMLAEGEDGPERLREVVANVLGTDAFEIGEAVAEARHAYSHFSVEVRAYSIVESSTSPSSSSLAARDGLAWLSPSTRDQFALHKAHDKLVRALWNDQFHSQL